MIHSDFCLVVFSFVDENHPGHPAAAVWPRATADRGLASLGRCKLPSSGDQLAPVRDATSTSIPSLRILNRKLARVMPRMSAAAV